MLSRCLLGSLLLAAAATGQAPMELKLPTVNEFIFSNQPEKFYMYTDRNFEGEVSKPWTGGQFGMTRTPVRTPEGVLFDRFHEGIDISPINRDKAGNPLDLITSIDTGKVAYVSAVPGRSNYGNYVVVEHDWGSGPFYSLYAHLAEITCQPGEVVARGATLGRMGFTGAGINRTRAHVHLELNILSSSNFDAWMKVNGGGINHHGNFNGMNLMGIDVAQLFIAQKANPALSVVDFIAASPVYFKITIPRAGALDILQRYPWLVRGPAEPTTHSWEISLTATGFPTGFAPSNRQVAAPTVTFVQNTASRHRYHTRGLLDGSGTQASLTRSGLSLLSLITGNFPQAQ
jgi:murein DD-endopeptidase MepM/ murein hydrolase activator NlpD